MATNVAKIKDNRMKALYESEWTTIGNTEVMLGLTCMRIKGEYLTYSCLREILKRLEAENEQE